SASPSIGATGTHGRPPPSRSLNYFPFRPYKVGDAPNLTNSSRAPSSIRSSYVASPSHQQSCLDKQCKSDSN
uniref:Uncharacterized protein n=1 Tax=Aegilops tauschii subsp. strangulata TaxID=200361 RepID=A0A453KXB5_AEGTS